MNADSWERMKDLFEQARKIPLDSQDAWLDALVGEDKSMVDEIRTLLAVASNTPTLMDAGAEQAMADFSKVEPDSYSIGEIIGPYVLLERVGSGGMGSVWRCRRNGEPEGSPQYAIKFIRRGLDTASVLKRFALERATLASLSHPNIARLVDGGLTQNDHPYLVMEFVDGQRIDAWCDARGLRTEERLAIFQVVCDAVHFAHKSLVIHRDLKPENILVTRDGIPVLLDFGVAKVLDRNPIGTTLTRGPSPLTPQFASPEQLQGKVVSTASDVYSLGIILFHLLCGHYPYRTQNRSVADLCQGLREVALPRPSLVVTAENATARGMRFDSLRRSLRGDVDTMVLKALRFEPDRRYDSAGQMAEDLRNYLQGHPVMAQSDTLRYRIGKLVRRNMGVSVTLFALLVVAGFSMFEVSKQTTIALEEAKFAHDEAESLHRVVDLLIGLFESSHLDGLPPDALSARDLVDRGWMMLEEGRVMEPLVRSTLLLALGRVFTLLGNLDKSEALLVEGVALRRAGYLPPHAEIAEALDALGALRLAQGRFEEADAILREAIEMWEETWGLESLDAANTENHLGLVRMEMGKFQEAKDYFKLALVSRQREFGPEHSSVLHVEGNIAGLEFREGHFQEAKSRLEDILDRLRNGQQAESLTAASHCNNLGLVFIELNELENAERHFRESLKIREELLEAGHPEIAKTRNNLAYILYLRKEFLAAADLFAVAAAEAESHLAATHPTVAALHLNQARALLRAGMITEAGPMLKELLSVQSGILPPTHPLLFQILEARGMQLLDSGQHQEAIPVLERALVFVDLESPPPVEETDLVQEALFEAKRRVQAEGD